MLYNIFSNIPKQKTVWHILYMHAIYKLRKCIENHYGSKARVETSFESRLEGIDRRGESGRRGKAVPPLTLA